MEIDSSDGVAQVLRFCRSDDRAAHDGIREYPGQRHLRRGDPSLLRDVNHRVDNRLIGVVVETPAELILLRSIGLFAPGASQATTGQRAPGNRAHSLVL